MACLRPCAAAEPRDPLTVNPPFPRIGTCYGAGLSWKTWEQGADWWSRVDLILGGGYDLHYDWDDARWPGALARLQENLTRLREANPHCLFLPYVDVVEGPDNPAIPDAWWDRRDGQRWSGWPGYYRIDTTLPDVLQFNLDRTRERILSNPLFDGVFYDCWKPDAWLVPRTAQLRDGKAIVMVNDWNLPRTGFATLNGCLAEDELNRVAEGTVAFEDYLARYLRWCRECRKPAVTMLVCHPRTVAEDPWVNTARSREQRQELMERARTADPQMLRFGLTTTLLGDGYFGYDGGNGLSRGNWWWYPEYDVPLGYPEGPAERRPDGLWQRRFDGGLVVVNGTAYDAVVETPRRLRDVSTGRVARRFTVPLCDGRILVPSDDPETPGEDVRPRLLQAPPETVTAVRLDDDVVVARTPGGLEARFGPAGELRQFLLDGQPLLTGGWPGIFNPPMKRYLPAEHAEPEVSAAATAAQVRCRGVLREGDMRIDYVETCTLSAEGWLTLRFEFSVPQALELRMWRHYVAFPAGQYAGASAAAGATQVVLPEALGKAQLLPAATQVTVVGPRARITVDSSVPLGLVDHRTWGSDEFLLAGYPLGGKVAAGTDLVVELRLGVTRVP
jgi:hypothetical protein